MYRKLAFLKIFWVKILWSTSFMIKLQPFSTQPSVLWKKRSPWKTFLQKHWEFYSQVNVFGGGFYSLNIQVQSLFQQFHKKELQRRGFPIGFFTVTLFKLSENFLSDVFAKPFLTKSQASSLLVATLMEITSLTKIYRTNF